ncbi:unnamed protein product, partial [Lymnaea stagnalis]
FTFAGIVGNVINVRVFYRQGVTSDSATVAFFSLSLTDLLSCVTLAPKPACHYLENYAAGTGNPFIDNCSTLTTMPASYTHGILSKVTCWITVYLSVERAVGVVFPLRVKRIFTVKITVAAIVIIYLVVVIAYLPLAANVSLVWIQDPNNNATLKALNVLTPLGYIFTLVNGVFHSFVMTTVAMFIVTVSTVATVTRLKASVKWRDRVAGVNAASGSSSAAKGRGKRSAKSVDTVRMVLAITSVYLVSLFCTHVPSMATLALPGMTIGGLNNYLYVVIYTIRFDFEAFNSSVHIFFYFRMSSRY